MDQFFFYHFLKQNDTSVHLEQGTVVWETCLRKIIFDQRHLQEQKSLELMTDVDALSFLLEVLCGVKSRVFGETEIFGQFKKFLETTEAKSVPYFQNTQFIQHLFKEVKEIREKHITGLSVNSYGSLIRKKCQNEKQVSFVGFGQLAEEIAPWLKHAELQFHVRQREKYLSKLNEIQIPAQISFHDLESSKFMNTVIVAAPISTKDLIHYFSSQRQIQRIIDCRGLDAERTSLKPYALDSKIELVELTDLFESLEREQLKAKQMIPSIQKEIHQRAFAYFMRSQHRPMGWEDLCG